MILLLAGGAFLLLRGGGLGSILGGVTAGYTAVGTDASGHPIYQGPVGSAAPSGYVQTSTAANGQPIYSYAGTGSAAGVLTMAAPILSGVSSAFAAIGKFFGGGGTNLSASPTVGTVNPAVAGPSGIIPEYDSSGNVVGGYRINPDGSTSTFDSAGNLLETSATAFGQPVSIPDISLPSLQVPDFTANLGSSGSLSDWLFGGSSGGSGSDPFQG